MAWELTSHHSRALRRAAPRYDCELDVCTYPCPWPPQSTLLAFLMLYSLVFSARLGTTVNSSNHCISSSKT